jgi:pantoate kinase
MGPAPCGTAFVPGHVTTFFSVHRRTDPLATGSRGAGIALSDGIQVSVVPAEETTVRLNGSPVAAEPVAGTLGPLGLDATVTAETPLPPGAGFGVSGGLALGSALAANHVADLARSKNELVRAAHAAEVAAGTGLGDVVAQARGGVPIRLEPGAPPAGAFDGVPATARIEYVSFGELDTASVIGGDTEALSAAGEAALERLRDRPTLPTLFAAGREFARDADLIVPRVEAAIEAVRSAGGEACMAMLGETVVSLGTGLSDAGYDPAVCRIQTAGAALRPDG